MIFNRIAIRRSYVLKPSEPQNVKIQRTFLLKIAIRRATAPKTSELQAEDVEVLTRSISEGFSVTNHVEEIALNKPLYDDNDCEDESVCPTPRSTESSLYDSYIALAMTTSTSSVEEQLTSLTQSVAALTKQSQEQGLLILKLMEKMTNAETSHANEKRVEDEDEEEDSTKHYLSEMKSVEEDIQIYADGMFPMNQLKNIVLETIKDKFKESSKSSVAYKKPYTKKVDNLKMLIDYQPPRFQQFDGKGNPRQHIAHFVETCNDAGTFDDNMLKQFIRSLKENVFNWYIDLEANSIDSWRQMKKEFLNQFYSTRRTVNMIELTSTCQWKEEPSIDYINRWRNLSLNCKD